MNQCFFFPSLFSCYVRIFIDLFFRHHYKFAMTDDKSFCLLVENQLEIRLQHVDQMNIFRWYRTEISCFAMQITNCVPCVWACACGVFFLLSILSLCPSETEAINANCQICINHSTNWIFSQAVIYKIYCLFFCVILRTSFIFFSIFQLFFFPFLLFLSFCLLTSVWVHW